MDNKLQERILAVTPGTKFGAIVRCALGIEREGLPRFEGRAIVTSDGFVMCNYVDSNGELHWGAFVGSKSDLFLNVTGLAQHLKLDDAEKSELRTLIDSWLGIEIIHVKDPAKTTAQS